MKFTVFVCFCFAILTAGAMVDEELGFDIIPYHVTNPDVSEKRPADLDVQAVVFHCMGVNLEEAMRILRGEAGYTVSAHYFIPQITGREFIDKFQIQVELKYPDQVPVVELVSPEKVAYHAGNSQWSDWGARFQGCEKGLNKISLGIEVHCPGYANGLNPSEFWDFDVFEKYNPAQKVTVLKLTQYLVQKHNLYPKNILAHSSIAPGRKTDPGPLFFWKELAEKELGRCVSEEMLAVASELSDSEKRNLVVLTRESLQAIGFPKTEEERPLTEEESVSEQICSEEVKQQMKAYFLQFDPDYWDTFSAGTKNHEQNMVRLIRGARELVRRH